MTTITIRFWEDPYGAARKTLPWALSQRERSQGVLKKAGGFSTQVTTRGPGGLLNNRGGFSTDLSWARDWGGGQELRKLAKANDQ